MSNPPYTIRNYQPADLEAFIHHILEAERREPSGRPISAEAIAGWMQRPAHEPEKNLFIVETGREIIGRLEVRPELASQRVILSGWIHPEHRRKGLATRLFDQAQQRASELKARAIRASIRQDNTTAKKTLLKLGFRRAREYFHLELETAGSQLPETEGLAVSLRPLQSHEAALLTELQNRCFTGAWEFNPNTVEEIARTINSPFCSPEDILLACDGDRAIGYCWTMVLPAISGQPARGQILMLGIDPDYRGRGLGRAVLLAGLAHLANKGVQIIELTVDSENKAAFSMYKSLGFKVSSVSLWYEKTLS